MISFATQAGERTPTLLHAGIERGLIMHHDLYDMDWKSTVKTQIKLLANNYWPTISLPVGKKETSAH